MSNESLIVVAEKKLGKRFPAKLRERLMQENGGNIRARGEEWMLYPVFDPTEAGSTGGNIVEATQLVRTFHGFPLGAVTIAENGEGDYLIFRGEDIELWESKRARTIPVMVSW